MTGVIRAELGVGALLLLAGSALAVTTWPSPREVALEGTIYPPHLIADLGTLVAMVGLLLVLLAGIAYGMGRVNDINQDDRP